MSNKSSAQPDGPPCSSMRMSRMVATAAAAILSPYAYGFLLFLFSLELEKESEFSVQFYTVCGGSFWKRFCHMFSQYSTAKLPVMWNYLKTFSKTFVTFYHGTL